VAHSTAKTNTKVKIISANNHNKTFPSTQSNPFAHKLSNHHNKTPKTNAHKIHQINCATM
jgi:hypothetical protein